MAVLLSCSALRKQFGERALFENLSLSLSEGDRTGLIGPNGSGKTTLLEILAGNEAPDATGPREGAPCRGVSWSDDVRRRRWAPALRRTTSCATRPGMS